MNRLDTGVTQQRDDNGRFTAPPEEPVVPKTIDDLKAHPLYAICTPKQQKFICSFVENKYRLVEAVKSAYNCKSDYTAEQQGRNLLRNWKVRKLVSFMGDYSMDSAIVTRKEAAALISERLRDKTLPPQWFCRLWDMLQEVRGNTGWKSSPIDKADASDIDRLVQQAEEAAKKRNGK
jgi:hypothetical protein